MFYYAQKVNFSGIKSPDQVADSQRRADSVVLIISIILIIADELDSRLCYIQRVLFSKQKQRSFPSSVVRYKYLTA